MNSPHIILKFKLLAISFLALLFSFSFAQDLFPGHPAYNSLTSVVDAMKLERTSCAEIGHYPQVGQSLCAGVPKADTFRSDWDLIVSNTGASFGLSPLGDWTSEPAQGIIHRTYLLGTTDLKVNYDVISSRITIDVLDPELQAEEAARQRAQAEADAAQRQAQAVYDQQQAAIAQANDPYANNTHVAQVGQQQAGHYQAAQLHAAQAQAVQTAQAQTAQQTVNGYDVSAAYPTQTTTTANGYVAANADGTAFVLADSSTQTTTSTVAATQQVAVDSRSYAPAQDQTVGQTLAQTTAQATTQTEAQSSGYATAQTGTENGYTSTTTQSYQAVAQTAQVGGSSQPSTSASTIAYAYTPKNLITAMGSTTQNSAAFQPSGAWQITSSGNPVTIELYDTQTQSFLRHVYPDQVYTDAGNYYLSIVGSAAWAISVWTE